MDLITLRAVGAGLVRAPEARESVARYWIERGGTAWDLLRPWPAPRVDDVFGSAGFALVPYSNRIRGRRRRRARGRRRAGQPVTDAFNLATAGRTDTGARALAPGETLRTVVTLDVEHRAGEPTGLEPAQRRVGGRVRGEEALDPKLVQGDVVGRAEAREQGEEAEAHVALLELDGQERRRRGVEVE